VDLAEFRPKTLMEKLAMESDTQKLVVLPGFEVAKQRPVTDIITSTWYLQGIQ